MAGVLVALAGRAAPLLAQSAPGTVLGVVADSAGGPLEGVEVQAGGRLARTNARGTFRLDSVPAGRQVLLARYPGYAPTRIPVAVSSGRSVEVAVRLLPAAYALPEVTVEGTRTGIFGAVVGPAFTPLAGARVQALGSGGREVVTDSSGSFAFPTIRSGVFLVRVTAPGFGEQRSLVDVQRGEGHQVRFRLLPSRTVATRGDEVAIEELGKRLAFGIDAERLTAADLGRYESLGLCALPVIRDRLRRSPTRTVNLVLNGTTVYREVNLAALCLWRADEVDLVEYGPEYCWEVTKTLAALISSGPVRCPMGRQPLPDHAYVSVWEKR